MTRLMPAVSAFLGATFTVGVCLALGSLLVRRLGLEFHRLEASLFAFVSGSACLSLAVFALCLVQQAKLEVFLLGGAAAIVWNFLEARRDPPRPDLPPLPTAWRVFFILVFSAFFLVYFSNALAPEISPDGSGYHLGNVARYWRHQGFAWDFRSLYSSLSQGMEMLFLVAFSIGRHPAAAMVHMAFQTALPLFIVCYGRRFGLPRVGAFAALLLYACPVAGVAGISAYNDLTVATLIFAGFYLLQVSNEIICNRSMFLLGLLSGFAYATKYTAGLSLLLAIGFTKGRRLLPLLAGAAIMAAPWLIRNWIWLSNPTAPFLNSWFPNPSWSASAEHQYLIGLSQYPPFKSYWDFAMQVTVLGGLVPGMLGPSLVLVPLAFLKIRHPQGGKLLLAGLVYAIPALLNTEIRFLLPAIPFFALALGVALQDSWGMLPAVALLQAVLCWPAVMDIYCDPNAWRVRGFQFRAAVQPESESHYIGSHVGDFALKSTIDEFVPPGQRIFSFAGRASAYLDRDIVVGYESSLGTKVQTILEVAAALGAGQREAVLQTKTANLDFLLVNDSDGISGDIKKHLNIWGLTELAKANGITLYRID